MPKDESENDDASLASTIRVLIVDNDSAHAHVMTETLERIGYDCITATTGPEGASKITSEEFHLVVTDLVMSQVDGIQILQQAKETQPDCEVVMVTGHGTIPKAVEAMQLGAFNFIEKPIKTDQLRTVVTKAAQQIHLQRTNVQLQQRLDETFGFENLVFSSPKMKTVVDRLKRIAPTDADVMIMGENGTGKELVAQAIHENSSRKKKPFVAINCGAVAENLVESELFGHIKGAFTHALTDRVGKFEYANGGTLFLDEVGDMPLQTQIKLLRVLEDRQVTRVGDNKQTKVNVRVISATNRDMDEAIASGQFRKDLFFRLNIVLVTLPSLADRREDIVPLVEVFRRNFAKKHGKTNKSVAPDVLNRMFRYEWPGNVRELRNAIETMVVLDNDGELGEDDLPPQLLDVQEADAEPNSNEPSHLIGKTMDEIEKWAIVSTLALTNGKREEAAKILKIAARTLYRKIEKYGL